MFTHLGCFLNTICAEFEFIENDCLSSCHVLAWQAVMLTTSDGVTLHMDGPQLDEKTDLRLNSGPAIRLALGALRCSPILSLAAESGERPLQYRFLTLTADFPAPPSNYSNF